MLPVITLDVDRLRLEHEPGFTKTKSIHERYREAITGADYETYGINEEDFDKWEELMMDFTNNTPSVQTNPTVDADFRRMIDELSNGDSHVSKAWKEALLNRLKIKIEFYKRKKQQLETQHDIEERKALEAAQARLGGSGESSEGINYDNFNDKEKEVLDELQYEVRAYDPILKFLDKRKDVMLGSTEADKELIHKTREELVKSLETLAKEYPQETAIQSRIVEDFAYFIRINGGTNDINDITLNYNVVITGNTGSGKTRLAKLLAKILGLWGIFSYTQHAPSPVVQGGTYNGSDLISGYVANTSGQVKRMLADNFERTCIVDEAYNMIATEYGSQAVNELLTILQNRAGLTGFFMLGYEDEMEDLLKSNQGFEGRFNIKIHMGNLTAQQLCKVFYRTYLKLQCKECPTEGGSALSVKTLFDMNARRTLFFIINEFVNPPPDAVEAPGETKVINFVDVIRKQGNAMVELAAKLAKMHSCTSNRKVDAETMFRLFDSWIFETKGGERQRAFLIRFGFRISSNNDRDGQRKKRKLNAPTLNLDFQSNPNWNDDGANDIEETCDASRELPFNLDQIILDRIKSDNAVSLAQSSRRRNSRARPSSPSLSTNSQSTSVEDKDEEIRRLNTQLRKAQEEKRKFKHKSETLEQDLINAKGAAKSARKSRAQNREESSTSTRNEADSDYEDDPTSEEDDTSDASEAQLDPGAQRLIERTARQLGRGQRGDRSRTPVQRASRASRW